MKRGRPAGRARPDEPLVVWCEVHLFGCIGRASHRHHIRRRAQGGSDDRSNTLDVCEACHRRIHDHPAESYELGLLKRHSA